MSLISGSNRRTHSRMSGFLILATLYINSLPRTCTTPATLSSPVARYTQLLGECPPQPFFTGYAPSSPRQQDPSREPVTNLTMPSGDTSAGAGDTGVPPSLDPPRQQDPFSEPVTNRAMSSGDTSAEVEDGGNPFSLD